MCNHFTMLWSKDYCDFMSQVGAVGEPLKYIWGGYNLQSNFLHFKVNSNDYIYPVTIRNFTLHLIARMRVHECISVDTFQNLFPAQSKNEYHSCAGQVLIGTDGTPIQFERPVPAQILERITFQSGKSTRKPKYVEDGKVRNISSFQGIYCLIPDSADDFNLLLE